MATLAYHNDPVIKMGVLAQLQAHRHEDEQELGRRWEGGKGRPVGCLLDHRRGYFADYPARFGIPEALARLDERFFEGLPNVIAKDWPERFMGSMRPGADLSAIPWQFLHFLLTDDGINPGITHAIAQDVIDDCTKLLFVMMQKGRVPHGVAVAAHMRARVAVEHAWCTEMAAWCALDVARRAMESIVRGPECGGRSVEMAAVAIARGAGLRGREAALLTAQGNWQALRAAANLAARADATARCRAYIRMSDRLLELIAAA